VTTADLIERVNKQLRNYGAEFIPTEGSATPNPTRVHGTIDGKPVRLEFSISNEHPAYDYTVWLYSNDSNETLGRGNGDSSFEYAISSYQWKGALSDLAAVQAS